MQKYTDALKSLTSALYRDMIILTFALLY